MITLLYGTRPPFAAAVAPDGDDLWIPAEALPAATGWTLKPEGLCQGERCVPVPQGLALARANQVNVTAVAKLLGQPAVRDRAHAVWCFGEAAPTRGTAAPSLEAPDFTLPDLDGRTHALRDYRGKKVFLVSWASW
jgi:hypothetical protein